MDSPIHRLKTRGIDGMITRGFAQWATGNTEQVNCCEVCQNLEQQKNATVKNRTKRGLPHFLSYELVEISENRVREDTSRMRLIDSAVDSSDLGKGISYVFRLQIASQL